MPKMEEEMRIWPLLSEVFGARNGQCHSPCHARAGDNFCYIYDSYQRFIYKSLEPIQCHNAALPATPLAA